MRFTYRLTADGAVWLAECLEATAAGEGLTAEEAVDRLREALEERMLRPDAVAPPSTRAREHIELAPAEPERR